MKIEIWSDIACPWCWIGKRRFERALEGFAHRDELDITWRSFELDPTAPARHAEPQAELLARKYRVPLAQAQAMNARMAGEAAKEGLEFHLDRTVVGNTFDAHRLIHLAAGHGLREAMVERLFAAYLRDGEALGEHETLVRLATEVGLPGDAVRAALATTAHADAVRADEARARAFGVSGVPFFAIDERYGVSGAQPSDVLRDVLQRAWEESHPKPVLTPLGVAPADGCADGSCAM